MSTKCKKCEIVKDDNEFPQYKGKRLGLSCKLCQRIRSKAKYEANPQYYADYQRKWLIKNKEKDAAWKQQYYLENKEAFKERRRKNIALNKGREVAYVRARKLKQIKRTPVWANLDEIKQIYINCPEGYEVDHIIPLNGKLVSGLHVTNNLQYLTKSENAAKHAKFNPMEFKP